MNVDKSDFSYSEAQFKDILLNKRSFIDVRAPIEFKESSFPGAVNFPILYDEERASVGTFYKKFGKESAVSLANELVSGEKKEKRIEAWLSFVSQEPSAILTCFRGGLRSKTAQIWCAERGVFLPRLAGGTKALRSFFLEQFVNIKEKFPMTVVGGKTGSAKSQLLREIAKGKERLLIDLENLASHRGSAFGAYSDRNQPSQIYFENALALELLKISDFQEKIKEKTKESVLIEDESRLVGLCAQPEAIFNKLRISPLVLIEEPLAVRVEHIFQEYVISEKSLLGDLLFDKFKSALKRITKKIGLERSLEILKDIENSEKDFKEKEDLLSCHIWIEKLLKYYYDPMYEGSLEKRNPRVLFKGTRAEVYEFLKNKSDF